MLDTHGAWVTLPRARETGDGALHEYNGARAVELMQDGGERGGMHSSCAYNY
jgi:hypothetical protein